MNLCEEKLDNATSFLRKQKMQVRLEDSRVIDCTYVEASLVKGFHTVHTVFGDMEMHEQVITILL